MSRDDEVQTAAELRREVLPSLLIESGVVVALCAGAVLLDGWWRWGLGVLTGAVVVHLAFTTLLVRYSLREVAAAEAELAARRARRGRKR